jgi:hypothetical protein
VAPIETVTIEFLADESNNWTFHCHLLYHLVTGMARVMSYEGGKQDTDVDPEGKLVKMIQLDNKPILWGTANIGVISNHLNFTLSNNKNVIHLSADANWKGSYEVNVDYVRYLGQYLRAFGGVDFGNDNFISRSKETDISGTEKLILPVAGFRYLLPFLIDAEAKVNTNGNVRFQLTSEQRLTRRFGLNYNAQWFINNYIRLSTQ